MTAPRSRDYVLGALRCEMFRARADAQVILARAQEVEEIGIALKCQVISAEQAVLLVWGDDPRPLLGFDLDVAGKPPVAA